jgi:hypothetical protein
MKFSTGKVYHGILPNTLTALTEPVPAGEAVVIKSIFVTNTNEEADSSIDLYVAPEGVTAPTKAHSLVSNLKYVAGEKENIHSLFVTLEPGDTLYGSQTTSDAVVIYVSGVKQQVV